MVWWPFATQPERADTLEVTDLHSGAPLLYSTRFVVNRKTLVEHHGSGCAADQRYDNSQ
jgi:hypothetical protein